jgi:hypothetical protein
MALGTTTMVTQLLRLFPHIFLLFLGKTFHPEYLSNLAIHLLLLL